MAILDHTIVAALDMIRSRTFDGRTELLEYAPTVLPGPPASNEGVER
jgi:hypothetical protein